MSPGFWEVEADPLAWGATMAHSDPPELPLSFLLALLEPEAEPASVEVPVQTRPCLERPSQPLRSLWGAAVHGPADAVSL